jgi:hypothetical protein
VAKKGIGRKAPEDGGEHWCSKKFDEYRSTAQHATKWDDARSLVRDKPDYHVEAEGRAGGRREAEVLGGKEMAALGLAEPEEAKD